MTYVHYRDDGRIVADPAVYKSKLGVGQYDAAKPIEAEWFSGLEGTLKKHEMADGGFELRDIHDGDHLWFPKVMHLDGQTTVSFRVAPGRPPGPAGSRSAPAARPPVARRLRHVRHRRCDDLPRRDPPRSRARLRPPTCTSSSTAPAAAN